MNNKKSAEFPNYIFFIWFFFLLKFGCKIILCLFVAHFLCLTLEDSLMSVETLLTALV